VNDNNSIKGIVFDLDGTLIDSVPTIIDSWYKAIKDKVPDVDKDAVERAVRNSLSSKDLVRTFICNADQKTIDELSKKRAENVKANISNVNFFPKVINALSTMKEQGIKLAIATAMGNDLLPDIIESMMLYLLVDADAIVSCDKIKGCHSKTDVVREAFKRLNVDPREGLVISDNEKDIEAGKKVGARTVLISKANYVAENANDVLSMGIIQTEQTEKRLIPKPARLKYEIDKSLTESSMKIEKREAKIENIKKILEDDANEILNNGSENLAEFMKSNGFAQFTGDIEKFNYSMRAREKIEFLLQAYVGKSYNNLEACDTNIDMTFLIFANRLNVFAKKVEELTKKRTKIVLLAENNFFDKYILQIKEKKSEDSVEKAKEIMEKLGGFEKVEIKMLDDFLPEDIEDLSNKELEKLRNNSLDRKLKETYDTFYLSYPTKNFDRAVELYTGEEGREEVKQWARGATLRYKAYLDARDNWGFYEKYWRDYIISTVSSKPNTVVFEYHLGRVTPLHGVSVKEKDKIISERLYDVAKDSQINGKKLILHTFRDIPLFFQYQ